MGDLKPGQCIERAWLEYRTQVLPAAAPIVQVLECRRAFFAGAWALLNIQMGGLTEDHEPTRADLDMMGSIDAELRAFYQAVKEGRA